MFFRNKINKNVDKLIKKINKKKASKSDFQKVIDVINEVAFENGNKLVALNKLYRVYGMTDDERVYEIRHIINCISNIKMKGMV